MPDLTLNTVRKAIAEMTDNAALSVNTTKMFLWGPRTDEEYAQAREVAARALKKANDETP